ncbi:MAG: adenylate/guanylate cyclase domain-containing protein [Pseudomonadota bacterium]
MKNAPFSKLLRHSAIWVAAVLLSLGVCFTPWGQAVDTFCYDFFFLLRGPVKPPDEIVIVAIDEASFGVLGHQWPWPRHLHATLIDTLFKEGARTIALDMIFSETSAPEEDRILADTVARHPSLILAADINLIEDTSYARETIVGPHPSLITPQTLIGSVNLPVEPDGFIRNANVEQNDAIAPLALAAGNLFSENSKELQAPGGARINFFGPARTIKTISYYQAVEPATHLPRGFLNGKLVFIGFSTQNTSDIGNTQPDHFPVPFTRWKGGYMPGVEIHASIAANLLQGNLILPFPAFWTVIFSVLPWAGMGFVFFRMKPLIGGGTLLLAGSFLLSAGYFLFSRKAIYVPVIYVGIPMTAVYIASPFVHYFESWREKNYIRKAFSTYVAPSVVKQLIEFPEQLKLGGEEREITAFFSDVQGFSTISEQLSPRELVELLNEFLTEMTDIILDYKGTVDKFEGDAIIAMFGAPNILENHAEAACCASIEMQKRLVELRKSLRSRGMPELKMRIGLCSGKAVVGNMGSKRRMDYTMMGDTVNTAARLEGANKIYGTYTLVSKSTIASAGKKIAARELDAILLVGKKESVPSYQLLGYTGELPQEAMETAALYAKGLDAYRGQSWETAIDYFEKALSVSPEDAPSKTMLNRCHEFKTHPPAENWDGSYLMKTK